MTKEALGELILSSERQLYATAKTILSDDQDCADAIQESIVKAFSKIDTLKKDRYAKTWLMRILINECYNIARRINVNEPLDEGYAENMKQPKENRDYSELYRAVNELKEELRIPVILYYMEEFNIREIAKTAEMTYSSVQDDYGNGKNYIPSLKPGESVQVNMAWIVNEKDIKNLYLNLNGTGGCYEITENMCHTGVVYVGNE